MRISDDYFHSSVPTTTASVSTAGGFWVEYKAGIDAMWLPVGGRWLMPSDDQSDVEILGYLDDGALTSGDHVKWNKNKRQKVNNTDGISMMFVLFE